MTTAAIEVENLAKTYREGIVRRRSVRALQGVSLSVERGSIFGLLGPNGAGKTTLIKILLGLVRRSDGQATLLGRPAGDRVGRRGVGYLPEHHRIPRHLNGNSALLYYGGLSGLSPREVRQRAPQLLERVGLGRWGTTSVKKYSKGMLQRLGLAQAMLHEPELLVLDEPTDGVDPVGRTELRDLLRQLRAEGKTIFINSHLLQEVELVCDRVAILVDGKVRRMGHVDEIRARQITDVQFTVVGSEALIRQAIDGLTPSPLNVLADLRTQFQLKAPDQTTINRCIDQLRHHQIDIVSIARLRDTLEDVFLDVVGQQSESPPTEKTDNRL
ncbi:MAG: ABC transporter ATP-binding protein [Pirellulales bacterium]